jgi:hypothetical protein
MAVLAASDTVVWSCPECGHGSPEPRDRQAHLDAHHQLRRFFEQWEAAAAADAADDRRRRRRPYLYGLAVVLAIALLGAVTSAVSGPRSVVAPTAAGPVPGVDLPRPGTAPHAEVATSSPHPPAVTLAPAAPNPPTPPSTSAVSPAAAAAPAVVDASPPVPPSPLPSPPPVGLAPAPTPPAQPPPTASAPAPPLVQGCLLVVCLSIG